MSIRTAFVTGVSGFIGHHLANALIVKGYKVDGIDRTLNNYKYLNKDINFIHPISVKDEFPPVPGPSSHPA